MSWRKIWDQFEKSAVSCCYSPLFSPKNDVIGFGIKHCVKEAKWHLDTSVTVQSCKKKSIKRQLYKNIQFTCELQLRRLLDYHSPKIRWHAGISSNVRKREQIELFAICNPVTKFNKFFIREANFAFSSVLNRLETIFRSFFNPFKFSQVFVGK